MESSYACLLIHGLGDSPLELKPLIAPLEKKGFMVLSPKLVGHGGSMKDLKGIDFKQWIFSAETALLKMVQQKYSKIYIVGLGMGGLIAMELAGRYNIGALVCVNTPAFSRYTIGRAFKSAGSNGLPVSVARSFRALLNKVKPAMRTIKAPIKIAQSEDEGLARVKSAKYLLRATTSKVKQEAYYEQGGYSLFTGASSGQAVDDTIAFFDTLEKISYQ